MTELAGLRTNDEEELAGLVKMMLVELAGLVKMMMVRTHRTRENDDGHNSPDS